VAVIVQNASGHQGGIMADEALLGAFLLGSSILGQDPNALISSDDPTVSVTLVDRYWVRVTLEEDR